MVAPLPDTGASAMSRSWPNENGRAWDYAVTFRLMTGGGGAILFPTAGDVPAVTMSDVDAQLAVLPDSIAGSGTNYAFRMQFDGDMTTYSGVTTQRLTESYPPAPAPARGGSGGFLSRLAIARPDLRARLAREAPPFAILGESPGPNFIHGYGYIKGPVWIGSYGDADTILAWKFMDATLVVGHTFRHQLVPSLANDVFLTAKVARVVSYSVPGFGTVQRCVEMRYLIDYGVSLETGPSGELVGYFRRYDCGRVIYAPGIGPVFDEERWMAFAGTPRDPGAYLLLLRATAVTPGPAALANR